MLSFQRAVERDFQSVNSLIVEQLHSDVALVENIGHHIVNSGGKRLRPILVLLMCRCLNSFINKNIEDKNSIAGDHHKYLAVIIEFIHTATLLHDDVVDISAMRRGKPTANATWGNAPSVLVGDFLYSRAFQLMVSMGNMDVMSILSNTTNLISEGEVQQLVNAKNADIDESNYLNVIHKKTAALFEAACECSAVVCGADLKVREQAKQYGYHLGMAFQLVDDALDYEGDPELLGKNVGDDIAEGKPTLPLIYIMKNGEQKDVELVRKSIEQGDTSQLNALIDLVQTSGGLQYTKDCALAHAEQARQLISHIDKSEFTTALEDLAVFSVERNH